MEEREGATRVDPLGEALHVLRMSGAFYCRSEFTAPWGLTLPAMPGCLSFHAVTSGRCWLHVEGAGDRLLAPGDFTLVPHGEGHRLSSEPGSPAPRLDELRPEKLNERYAVLRHGGGGEPTTLICGAVRFDHPAAHYLVALLPRILHVEATDAALSDWMRSTLRLMAVEAREMRPGGEAITTRLADILVVQAIRSWIQDDPAAQTGWLGALQDPQIGRAIALIHHDPARRWTVASLASHVAMSRSAFAAHFTELVGEPVMQYLSRWRMHLALTWLQEGSLTLAAVADRLGYQSDAAFSRAFKRIVGRSPGRVRRGRRALAAAAE